jgi:hypothetical protein
MPQPMPHPRPDPVIQSLAIRAASDPDLKALMRIVASGKATTEQLKIFQGHIDALTPPSNLPVAGPSRPLAPIPVPPNIGHTTPAPPQQLDPHSQTYQHGYPQRPVQYTTAHPVPGQVQAAKQRPFPQQTKREITSVVFEFNDPYSQGDRFLFPKFTILEYVNNDTMVRASFIVVRKPVDDLDEYFQPITVVLESTSPKTLEILQKVVADPETTRKYMKELMATRKRADDSFLVFRLRRDPSEAIPEKPEIHGKTEPPTKATSEAKARRDTSTPVRDSKGSSDNPSSAPSRPRVKTVKKVSPGYWYC